MSEDLSEGEKGDVVGDISAHGDSNRGRMPRINSTNVMDSMSNMFKEKKLYIVLIRHGLNLYAPYHEELVIRRVMWVQKLREIQIDPQAMIAVARSLIPLSMTLLNGRYPGRKSHWVSVLDWLCCKVCFMNNSFLFQGHMGKSIVEIGMAHLHGLIHGESMELGRDSDTGGQVKYVVELARALRMMPGVYRVDLLTRQVQAPGVDWTYGEPTEMLTPLGSDGLMNEVGESSGSYTCGREQKTVY